MKNLLRILASIFITLLATSSAATAEEKKDFNEYILEAVELLANERAGGGYDINSAFTRNLKYGPTTIKSSNPPKTMCVAAIIEVIVEAINLYANDHGDSVYSVIPVSSWTKGNLTSLRANIFMYKGAGSRGTGHTLDRFGLGTELKFSSSNQGIF